MQKYFSLVVGLLSLFDPSALLSQTRDTLKVVAQANPLSSSTGFNYSEVAGAGDLAVIGGHRSSSFVWIYDTSNKTTPVLLSAIPINQPSWDVQVHGRYLFIALTERMEWYDILDPSQPKFVAAFPFPHPHTFFVAGNTLYVAEYISGAIEIYDITDKKNPQLLSRISEPFWGIHDITVIRKRLYGAFITGYPAGLLLSDVTDPAKPKELARVQYSLAATHNAWPTEDEQFILTTDEVSSQRNNLKIWDARTPGQLTRVAEYEVPGASSPIHNVYVRGRYAYISYYCEGVRIVDIADPTKPQQVAFNDLNGNSACVRFNSNWGVYPFAKLIYASDIQRGLYVLEFSNHPAANFTGRVVDAATSAEVSGAMVYFRDEYPTTRTNAAGEFDIPWFKNDRVAVVTEAAGYHPDTTFVTTHASEKTTVTIRLRGLGTGIAATTDTPKDFALLQNYPNPFSSTLQNLQTPAGTQIVFRLPQAERVQLEIFNIQGQRVRALLQAAREPGKHAIWWNGADDAGQVLPAGIYLARLHAGKFSAAKEITLMR